MGEDRQTEVPAGFHRPRRQNTWPRARQVVVLIRSDDSVYLENREEVDGKFYGFWKWLISSDFSLSTEGTFPKSSRSPTESLESQKGYIHPE